MASVSMHLALFIVILTLAACGKDASESGDTSETNLALSAATLGEQLVLPVSEYLLTEQYADASRRNGSSQALICKACHSLDEGGGNMIGPALFGFFGRPAGAQAGFDYSPVMRNADFVWTPRALDAWLAQPSHFLPGNRMTFAGVFRQQDRDDLIAYLLDATSPSQSE